MEDARVAFALRADPTRQDSLVTVSLLRSKLPRVKIVGFSILSVEPRVSGNWFDAVLAQQDGLSKLEETLKMLIPEPPG